MSPNHSLLVYPWIVLGAVWIVAAASQKAVTQRQPLGGRLLHALLALAGFWMLAKPWPGFGLLNLRFAPQTTTIFLAGFALEIAGAAFAVWARLAIGRNWSGRPSLMAGHELVTSGPYAVARHPIYTGLIFAALGTALAIGAWRCLAGVALILIAFLAKIRTEERLMLQAFPDHYPHYRRHVKALIPGVF